MPPHDTNPTHIAGERYDNYRARCKSQWPNWIAASHAEWANAVQVQPQVATVSLTSITPQTNPLANPNQNQLTIKGTGFTKGNLNLVRIGSESCRSVVIMDDSTLVCNAPSPTAHPANKSLDLVVQVQGFPDVALGTSFMYT